MALGTVLLYGPSGGLFLMMKVPLYLMPKVCVSIVSIKNLAGRDSAVCEVDKFAWGLIQGTHFWVALGR